MTEKEKNMIATKPSLWMRLTMPAFTQVLVAWYWIPWRIQRARKFREALLWLQLAEVYPERRTRLRSRGEKLVERYLDFW